MPTVVKVQLPLATNRPPPLLALVYPKDRKFMVEQRLDAATLKAMGDDVKAFFEADYRASQSTWTIGRRVKDRNW